MNASPNQEFQVEERNEERKIYENQIIRKVSVMSAFGNSLP